MRYIQSATGRVRVIKTKTPHRVLACLNRDLSPSERWGFGDTEQRHFGAVTVRGPSDGVKIYVTDEKIILL